ncbi:MAG TPA: sigma-70 family RNA polymerase sigma factor [Gemmataceae bacterium]
MEGRQPAACSAINANVSDAELLERFVSRRDEGAFAALMLRHSSMVFGVCRRILHHAQDAEDAFQATFLILVRKAADIGQRELLGNWLYGVAVRVATRARLTAARRRTLETADTRRIAESLPHPSETADFAATIEEEVQRLPAKYRGPVVLCYLEGRTNEDAAGELRWPVGTVKGRLARARELLRKRLIRRGLVLSAGAMITALSPEALAAMLPPGLFDSTLKAATAFAAGDAATGGLASAQAVALMKGVLHTMFATKMKTMAALLLALAVLVGGAGAFDYHTLAREADAKKSDKEKIQGEWKVESAKVNGEESQGAEGDRIKGATWTIAAEKITVTFNGEDRVATYKLDPAAKPKAIDVMTEKEGTFKGIYKLEGDTLTICATLGQEDGERPTEFVSKEGSSTMLFVLKRKK